MVQNYDQIVLGAESFLHPSLSGTDLAWLTAGGDGLCKTSIGTIFNLGRVDDSSWFLQGTAFPVDGTAS